MNMIQIVGIGLCGAVTALMLKEYRPVFSVCIGIITVIVVFFRLINEIRYVFDVIQMISSRLSIDTAHITTIIRIIVGLLLIHLIGITYLTCFGSELCRDAGQNAIAQKIDLAGKITIVAASIPILTAVLNVLIGILP